MHSACHSQSCLTVPALLLLVERGIVCLFIFPLLHTFIEHHPIPFFLRTRSPACLVIPCTEASLIILIAHSALFRSRLCLVCDYTAFRHSDSTSILVLLKDCNRKNPGKFRSGLSCCVLDPRFLSSEISGAPECINVLWIFHVPSVRALSPPVLFVSCWTCNGIFCL